MLLLRALTITLSLQLEETEIELYWLVSSDKSMFHAFRHFPWLLIIFTIAVKPPNVQMKQQKKQKSIQALKKTLQYYTSTPMIKLLLFKLLST